MGVGFPQTANALETSRLDLPPPVVAGGQVVEGTGVQRLELVVVDLSPP